MGGFRCRHGVGRPGKPLMMRSPNTRRLGRPRTRRGPGWPRPGPPCPAPGAGAV